MPRQTNGKSIQFPDGFKMGIDKGNGYEDVGVLSGGALATFNWDDLHIDAGNYEDLVDMAVNPVVALAPSAILNWNPAVIASLFPGFMQTSVASSPSAGTDIKYKGTSKRVTLTRVAIRLAHFATFATHALIAANITAITVSGTNNSYVTVPKTTFTGALAWTTAIDGFIEIDGMHEVPMSAIDAVASRGGYATDTTNLYLIQEKGTYADVGGDNGLAAAKADLAGTDVKFYKAIDWQFILYNAKVDAGGSFNFKGVNEDGLDEITVSFTGQPDPAQSFRLFRFFKLS